MAKPKVYNGSSWVEGILKSYNGARWEDVAKFYDGTAWVDLNAQAELGSALILHSRSGLCWAGLKFRNVGDIYKYQSSGIATTVGAPSGWLVTGDPAAFWIRCTVTSGSLTSGSHAAGVWHQLGVATRNFYVNTSLGTPKATNVTIAIASDSAGSNILATQSYFFQARDTS